MEYITHDTANKKRFKILMLVALGLLTVKYIFVDFGIDAEFQIIMSYRMAMGDSLFSQMWEPCQTSAFLGAFFIKLYLYFFHTTTGLVLYMQLIGFLLDFCVSAILYRTVKKHLDAPDTAFFMAWIYLLVSPKDFPTADYANMQVWFSTLACIMLFLYFKTSKNKFIICTAIFLCGAVLSYPSSLLICFAVAILLLLKKQYKATALLTGVCFLIGGIYLGYIFLQVSPSDFLKNVSYMLSIETAHSAGIAEKTLNYLKDFGLISVTFFISYLCSFGIIRLVSLKRMHDKEQMKTLTDLLFLFIVACISLYTVLAWETHVRYNYSLCFLALIIIGAKYTGKLNKAEFEFWLSAMVIAGAQLLATLLLTNLVFIASVPYLLLAVAASFIPLSKALATLNGPKIICTVRNIVVLFFIGMLIFRNAYIIRPMYGDVKNIFTIAGIVKSGPAIGIISEYMGPYVQNESIKEWEQYVKDGQNIYLLGTGLDTLGYLYKNTGISAPSVVPTPGYSEAIGEYWKNNPEKYPDMIIASCLYGELNGDLTSDTWIMQWLENEFQPDYYIDGKYWRYYIKEVD